MRHLTRIFVALIPLSACAPAATAPDDQGEGDIGKGDGVNPIGTQNEGYFVATAPPSTRGYFDSRLFLDGTFPMEPNVKYRIPVRKNCLDLFGQQGTLGIVSDCTISISSGATTELALAWIHPHWDPAAFAVDLGPKIAWPQVSKDGVDLPFDSVGLDADQADAPRDTVTLPGTYVFDFQVSAIPPTTVTVAPGEGRDLDLTVDRRAAIHVIPPTREFPDSPCAAPAHALNQLDANGWIRSGINTTAATETVFHVFPVAQEGGSYTYGIGGDMTMTMPLAANQTYDMHVRRIDVNDVAITREDGSVAYVPGTYTVSWDDPRTGAYRVVLSGSFCTNPTKTGVDVIPGQYKIDTAYEFPEGIFHDIATLDLR